MRGVDTRNLEIAAAIRAGERPTLVAARFGLSRQRVSQLLNPEKASARETVKRAVRRGEIVRPDRCERCDSHGRVDAHHSDYFKPLKVAWLCRICHSAADKTDATRLPRVDAVYQPKALSEEETARFLAKVCATRRERSLSQRALAEAIGCFRQQIAKLESAPPKHLSMEMAEKLARALGYSVESLCV